MDKLKTDGDVMIHLVKVRKHLRDISQQIDQSIYLEISPDGYARVIVGDYEASEYPGIGAGIEYRPARNLKAWQDVEPQQIRFGKTPVTRK
ncbi:hypothetical protein [Blautia marasmi]|uniref:hypothetical protein n=1 Tax=Blautia marasmi TaxID=1917868 RepID=UPI000CF27F57|nr:hypothetical protein [Blautia marasmi]